MVDNKVRNGTPLYTREDVDIMLDKSFKKYSDRINKKKVYIPFYNAFTQSNGVSAATQSDTVTREPVIFTSTQTYIVTSTQSNSVTTTQSDTRNGKGHQRPSSDDVHHSPVKQPKISALNLANSRTQHKQSRANSSEDDTTSEDEADRAKVLGVDPWDHHPVVKEGTLVMARSTDPAHLNIFRKGVVVRDKGGVINVTFQGATEHNEDVQREYVYGVELQKAITSI
ncbi:hypothetical protein SAMD00019534_011020 [Acytostelium subglobosum LB1]|uniref:hypothetical protein n=1 Tax=Acytostelium subglobosum LB1 TaxID=1410327 RepID=UPI000644E1EA|nr:hypothetical protein SAMD00019534_011020 [Acytostelium subglobosum LB1]GAM17927.1 hypothetical protein SAMD00019534_011020 [Acytostelium subglobosum LB1]|eukprot:XP_012758523.1 hypothetical protein SAMD00019534_011020 [Acytostelium subglobosum LB1]